MKDKSAISGKAKSQLKASRSRRRRLAVEMLEDRRLLAGVDPTDFEQYSLELINRAREFTLAEVARLSGDPSWAGTPDLNEGLTPDTISTAAKQPLAFDTIAIKAARDYSVALLAANDFTHTLNGTSSSGRLIAAAAMAPAGNLLGSPAGENIGVGASSTTLVIDAGTSEARHNNLFVDANVSGRGHRMALMNDTFCAVGVGLADSTTYTYLGAGILNAVLVTQDFESNCTSPILTGVAYTDTDNNNFYTPGGEGLGGVTLSATLIGGNGVPITTQTFASGGYSLPLPSGMYEVTAMGAFGTTAPITVTIGSQNVKRDFIDPVGATNTSWQNQNNPLDVNDDGDVSPIDVLQVINELNQRVISLANVALPAPGTKSPPPFLDVNGDSFVTPLDALVVINSLNAPSVAEGEAVQTPFRSAIPEVWWLPESEQKSTPLWTELTDRFFSRFLNNP